MMAKHEGQNDIGKRFK